MPLHFFRRRISLANNRRLAIRQHWPWPVRMFILLLILLAGLGLALLAYERMRQSMGIEQQLRGELQNVQTQLAELQSQSADAELTMPQNGAVMPVVPPLALANQTTIDMLSQQIRDLQAENQTLKDELGFFEYLLPLQGSGSVSIRSFQVNDFSLAASQREVQWQLLVMQPRRDAAAFSGRLQLQLKGTRNGNPWESTWPSREGQKLEFSRFQRLEGKATIPDGVRLTAVTARVLQAGKVLSSQTTALGATATANES